METMNPTTNINQPVAMTLVIKNSMDRDEAFADWAVECLNRHRDADWGDVDFDTWLANNDDPEQALSTYAVPDYLRHHVPAECVFQSMWVVQNGVVTTMLWPAEY